LVAGIIGKCISNMSEFTKAYNIILKLREEIKFSLEVVKKDKTQEDLKMEDRLGEIMTLMSTLIKSRRTQFLNESKGVYYPYLNFITK